MPRWIWIVGLGAMLASAFACAAEAPGLIDAPPAYAQSNTLDPAETGAGVAEPTAAGPDEHFRAFDSPPAWPEAYDGGADKGIGTDAARASDWQFFAALRGRSGTTVQYDCGGSAISAEWVLTAAHCLEGAQRDPQTGYWSRPGKGPIEVVLGQHDLKKVTEANVYRAVDVRVAGDYQRKGSRNTPVNDVALIRLDEAWNGPVVRLSGSRSSDVDRFFGQVFFAGHGNTERETAVLERFDVGGVATEAFAPDLQAGLIPARSPESCLSDYDYDAFYPDSMICAGFDSGAVDACQGDSGGPLIARDQQGRVYQVGIVSSGFSCGADYSPGLYARVSAFKAFISEAAGPSVFVDAVPEFSVTITKAGLNALRDRVGAPGQPGKVALQLSRSAFVYREGQRQDHMTLTIASTVPGRLWVFDLDAETGKATCLFPCTGGEIRKSIVAAGETTLLPGDLIDFPIAPNKLGPGEIVAFVLPPRVALVSSDIPDLGLTKGPPETIRIEYPELIAAEFDMSSGASAADLPAGVASATYIVE